jgi:hypothetical protein
LSNCRITVERTVTLAGEGRPFAPTTNENGITVCEIIRLALAGFMVMLAGAEAVSPEASVTVIVKPKLPAEVGIPPNCGFASVNPFGRFPVVMLKI